MGLFDNPFYILGASPKDTRRVLAEKAEARILVMDEAIVREAYNALTNPAKRLIAELEWFPEFEDDKIAEFLSHAPNSTTLMGSVMYTDLPIHTTAPFLLFLEWAYQNTCTDPNKFKAIVVLLGSGYRIIDRTAMIDIINAHRREAGFCLISSVQEIEDAFQHIRHAIRTELARHAKSLSRSQYVWAARQLAEEYDSSDRCAGGNIVLRDVIDTYALAFDTDMRAQMDDILNRLKPFQFPFITGDRILPELRDIFHNLEQWNYLAFPLQLRENHQGMTHRETERIVSEARHLCHTLPREEALFVNGQLRSMYARFPVFAELLTEDLQTLTDAKEKTYRGQNDPGVAQTQPTQPPQPAPFSPPPEEEPSLWDALTKLMAITGWVVMGIIFLLLLFVPDESSSRRPTYSSSYGTTYSAPSYSPSPTMPLDSDDYIFQGDEPTLTRMSLISTPPAKESACVLSPELINSLDPAVAEEVTALWQELNTLSNTDLRTLEHTWSSIKGEMKVFAWGYTLTKDETYLDLIDSMCDECEPVYDEYSQALERYNKLAREYNALLRQATPS